jgi:transposase
LSQRAWQRLKVIENAVEGRWTVQEAAELLPLSGRQVQRLKKKHDERNPAWAYPGNRGRQPANALAESIRQQVIEFASGKYAGFHDAHRHEKLTQAEGLKLSRQSVRRILRQAKRASPPRRRPPQYRSRRERRTQEGRKLLVDASRHAWLEGRGPSWTWFGLVDDATSKGWAAHFQWEHEDAVGSRR